jgi:putative oxidoreductase
MANDREHGVLRSMATACRVSRLADADPFEVRIVNNLSKYQPQFLGLLRIVTALLFIEHGTQKLFQFPAMSGGGGGAGGGDMPPFMGTLFLVAGILETFGGLGILLGFLTRPIAFILAGECAVIFWWMHVAMFGHGSIIPLLNGGESAVLFCFTFLYLVFAGPGAFAVDNVLFRRRGTAAA